LTDEEIIVKYEEDDDSDHGDQDLGSNLDDDNGTEPK
jgi:hypothetical protein